MIADVDHGVRAHDEALALLRRAIQRDASAPLRPQLVERGLGPYRGYRELLGALERLVDAGATLRAVGESVRREPLWSLSMGNPDPAARTSVVVAGIHPNEWIGIETGLCLCERLLEADLGDRAVIVFPLSNPDGLRAVEHNLRAGRWRFVRHNARGVDLNRNFDARWGHRSLVSRLLPGIFRAGRHPASEPEVAAIARALGDRRVDRALSLHSFGGVVLYPSAHSRLPIEDAVEHRRWARRIADRAAARPYRVLPPSWWGLGLFTMGGLELDWFHERHGALSLLVECSRGGIGAPSLRRRSAERLCNPFAWFNPPALSQVASRIADAALPFVRGDAE